MRARGMERDSWMLRVGHLWRRAGGRRGCLRLVCWESITEQWFTTAVE